MAATGERWIGAAASLLLACADDPLAPAPLAEVCGAAGPVRLLALAADERPAPEDSIVRVGDRIVLVVGVGERPDYSPRWPLPASTTVHAIGPCGEDPVILGRDIDSVFTVPQRPGEVFGCAIGSRDLMRLDPTGAAEPERLASPCDATWTPAGLVHNVRGDTMSVLIQRYIESSAPSFAAPVVLLDGLPVVTSTYSWPRALVDGVLALRADGDLVYVEYTGDVRVEASGVRYFALSPDDRYLLWQSSASDDPDAEFPEGDIFVRDLATGTGASLVHAHLPARNGNPLFPEIDAAQITLGETLAGQWLIELPSFTPRQLPPGRQINRRIADGRWLVRSDRFGPYLLRDLATGAESPLTDRKGQPSGALSEHVDVLLADEPLSYRDMRRLLRYPFVGGAPRELADRATEGHFLLADGRVVTPVGIDARGVGALVIVDPVTLEELQIDDRVIAAADLGRWHDVFAADEVAYVVTDGERSGVWLARPR